MNQPIIRGIQAVGAVAVYYQYNSSDGMLPIPSSFDFNSSDLTKIDTSGGIRVAGFRLDGEYFSAAQQVSSSNVIPILGGGGVALTNNNRTGTITFTCAKVSVPFDTEGTVTSNLQMGPGSTSSNMGVVDTNVNYYDMVLLAQLQQSQEGGDSVGSTIMLVYTFNGIKTKVQFEGCTIANISPLMLSGNDAATYSIQVNYLNWKMDAGSSTDNFIK